MTHPVNIGKNREQRGKESQGWIPNTDRSAAIRADRVPDGTHIQTTGTSITLNAHQTQTLLAQIHIESRKTR